MILTCLNVFCGGVDQGAGWSQSTIGSPSLSNSTLFDPIVVSLAWFDDPESEERRTRRTACPLEERAWQNYGENFMMNSSSGTGGEHHQMNKRREKEFPRNFSNFHLIIICFIGLTDWSHLYVCYGNQNECQRGKRKLLDGFDLHSRISRWIKCAQSWNRRPTRESCTALYRTAGHLKQQCGLLETQSDL